MITVLQQKLEKDRLVERFLADSSEPVDSVLCITIRRILGIVISSTPREEGACHHSYGSQGIIWDGLVDLLVWVWCVAQSCCG